MARPGTLLVVVAVLILGGCRESRAPTFDELIRAGEYAEAEQLARAHLDDLEATGPDSVETAIAIDDLVTALYWEGRDQEPETLALAERTIRIKRGLLVPEDPEIAWSLDNLALLRLAAGDVAEAESLFVQSMTLRESSLDDRHPDVAESRHNLGGLYAAMGRLDEAAVLLEKALAVREEEVGPESYETSLTLNFLAPVLFQLGDYTGARPLYERALVIRERELGVDNPRVAGVLNNLAILENEMGDFDSAQRHYERALRIRREALGEEAFLVLSTKSNLAHTYWRQGSYEEAEQLARKALEAMERSPESNRETIGLTLDLLGKIAYSRGSPDEARAFFEQAIDQLSMFFGSEHPYVTRSMHGLAYASRDLGRLEQSLEIFEQNRQTWTQALGPDHPYTATSELGRASVLLQLGDLNNALDSAVEAEAKTRQHLRLTARAIAEGLGLRYASVRESGLDIILSIAAQGVGVDELTGVFDAVIQSRAMVLDEMAGRQRDLYASADPEIRQLARELAKARSRLANLTVRAVSGDPQQHAARLERARRTRDLAEERLARKNDRFRRELEREAVDFSMVRESLPARSALVSIVRYDRLGSAADPMPTPSYMALVVEHDRDPVAVPLGTADEIDWLVSRWREEINTPPAFQLGAAEAAVEAYRKVGTALRRVVWDPIERTISGAKIVFIVPDGAPHKLSFASLPTGNDTYLVEAERLLHYLSTERDLVRLDQNENRGSGLLAIGNPEFGSFLPSSQSGGSLAERECGSIEGLVFGALPQSEREVQRIGHLWSRDGSRSAVVATGSEATEERLKRLAAGTRVIHLATHGFFLGEECRARPNDSRGIAGLSGATEGPTAMGNAESPLLLSGLVFAGANERGLAGPDEDDGILTAEEIAGLNLQGVEWVVLSACDTGLGEIHDGEGVLGLRRSFQVAGAWTLIMSMWPVEDLATREWMTGLYRARLGGASTVEAVRQATVTSIARRRSDAESTHPFYWGAFLAAGEWR